LSHSRDSHTQRTRSDARRCGRFWKDLRSMLIWCRRARISTWRAARDRKLTRRVDINDANTKFMDREAEFSATTAAPIQEAARFIPWLHAMCEVQRAESAERLLHARTNAQPSKLPMAASSSSYISNRVCKRVRCKTWSMFFPACKSFNRAPWRTALV
jgi:hypothetical protein